jgi:mevalonate kinase
MNREEKERDVFERLATMELYIDGTLQHPLSNKDDMEEYFYSKRYEIDSEYIENHIKDLMKEKSDLKSYIQEQIKEYERMIKANEKMLPNVKISFKSKIEVFKLILNKMDSGTK